MSLSGVAYKPVKVSARDRPVRYRVEPAQRLLRGLLSEETLSLRSRMRCGRFLRRSLRSRGAG